MAKSRQSNAIMTFMAHNDFARFAHFARKRRNEKQGILEKSCHNTIFIISNFNGGHRNGKKSSEQRRNDVHGSQLFCSLCTLCSEKKNQETRHPRKKLLTHNLYTFKFCHFCHFCQPSQNGQIDTKPKFQNFKTS
jgi:hypothetical protein